MANGWTAERRARQAELIRTWRPWEQSTGPRTADGRAITANNAYKGGHLKTLRELSGELSRALREQRLALAEISAG